MSLVLDTGTMKYRENPNQPWRPLVIKAGMNWESMADTYDPNNGTYEVGQYVLEEGMMYRCISEITTPEAWTPAHWTSVNVGDELSSFIIISDDQPTDETNKIWISETTAPFGVQVPTMDDHNALENTLNQLDAEKADKASLAYRRSGATNTGAQIENGTYFYLDGTLKRAIATIAQNASFTDQNCETVTAGGLNSLNDTIKYEEGNINNGAIQWKKFGRVGMVYIGNGQYSGTTIAELPYKMRPEDRVDVRESYGQKRIQIDNDAVIRSNESLSNTYIRGTITYITAE